MSLISAVEKKFDGKRIAIVGDAVADQFLNGTITRVSREASVFIMRHDETLTRPGGAANAAANVASMGGVPMLVAFAGEDEAGGLLSEELTKAGVDIGTLVRDAGLKTTTKVRVLAGHQHAPRNQVIRIDHENHGGIPEQVKTKLLEHLSDAVETADAIIVSDYGYGTADEKVYNICLRGAAERGIPILVDSRFRLSEFYGAVSATPNQEEVENLLGSEMTDDGCASLRTQLGYKALLVTCGSRGMRLYEEGCPVLSLPAVGSADPVDVTGAGDTVIAAYALGLAAGLGFGDAARIANHAGGIVVMKRGTASVSAAELIASFGRSESGVSHTV